MKIKMRTLCAGPSGVLESGKTYEVPDAFGRALVAGHYADPVQAVAAMTAEASETPEAAVPVPEAELETADLPAPEVSKPRRGKRAAN